MCSLFLILFILLSNAVTLRRDVSVLFNKVANLALSYFILKKFILVNKFYFYAIPIFTLSFCFIVF